MTSQLQRKTTEMGEHSIFPLLLRYAIPTTIGSAAFTIYNMVDRMFIGRTVGPDAIAGISITFPIFMICIAIGMMIGIGSGARSSLRLGEGRYKDAEKILGNAVAMFITAAIVLSILAQIFLRPLLQLFGASDTTLPYAIAYMRILLCFIGFDFLALGMNGLLRAEGNSRISMMTLVSGSLLNILLDYLFIVVFDFGVAGAAWGTAISKFFSAAWILLHFRFSRHRVLTLHLKNLWFDFKIVLSILHIGISPFIMQFAGSMVVVLLNRALLKYGGDAAVGAMGAIFSLIMLLTMPAMGIMQGAQPIFGFNYGAKNYHRVRETLLYALAASFACTLLGAIIIEIFPSFFLQFFAQAESQLVIIGTQGVRIMLLFFPLAAIQMIVGNYYQATGRPMRSILLNASRQVFCFLLFLQILPPLFGLQGVWMVTPASDCISFLISAAFIYFELKHLNTPARKHITGNCI